MLCSSRSSVALVRRSCRPLDRVVASRFWIFLTITTSSGGRRVRSSGFVVDERGDDGVNCPKEPNAPKSDDMKEGPLDDVLVDLGYKRRLTLARKLVFSSFLTFDS
jgi:hypothetical protein